MTPSKVGEGGAGVHPQGGAEGGAKVGFCEGIVRCAQPKERSLILSPRYFPSDTRPPCRGALVLFRPGFVAPR